MLKQALFTAFAFVYIYFVTYVGVEFPVGVLALLKVLPILHLFVCAMRSKDCHPTYRTRVLTGLLFSMGGDACLQLDMKGYGTRELFFIVGLASFLLAHVFYAVAFVNDEDKRQRWAFLVLIYAIGVAVWFVLRGPIIEQGKRRMLVPVLAYVLVIGTMVYFASTRIGSRCHTSASQRSGMLGALLFTVSDTILAFNRYYSPIANERQIAMTIYYLAQYFISSSCSGANNVITKKSE